MISPFMRLIEISTFSAVVHPIAIVFRSIISPSYDQPTIIYGLWFISTTTVCPHPHLCSFSIPTLGSLNTNQFSPSKPKKKQLGLTQTYSTIYHVVSPSLLVNRRISPDSQVDVPTRRGVGQTSRPNTCPSAALSQAEMLAWQQQGEGTRAWMKCF